MRVYPSRKRNLNPLYSDQRTLADMVWKFVQDETGLETAEYAIMTALIVAVLVTSVVAIADVINNRLDLVADAIDALPDPE